MMKNASELQVVLVSNFASFIQSIQSVIMIYLSNKGAFQKLLSGFFPLRGVGGTPLFR